jgi:HEPN domain-containing protein
MNRRDFQKLAKVRLEDAKVLLQAKRWSAAYYLAGYAVECSLKACVAKLTQRHDFPDKEFAQKVFTHNIDSLILHAGLKTALDALRKQNPQFDMNYNIVISWRETARYDTWSQQEAVELLEAITDETNGVLTWIEQFW